MQKWHGEGSAYGVNTSTSAGTRNSSSSSNSSEPNNVSGPGTWEAGDVVGCRVRVVGDGSSATRQLLLSFSLNGVDLGTAFKFAVENDAEIVLFPAISMNEEEEVIINLGQMPFLHLPGPECAGVIAMFQPIVATLSAPLPLDFDLNSDAFSTTEVLESLGLEALKTELDKRGLKTGGSLSERAARLLAVRGLAWDQIDKKHKQKPTKA
jgi:hypothetical protein